MISCLPNDLAEAARCYKCIPSGVQREVQTYLLCQIANAMPRPGWSDLVFDPARLTVAGGANAGTVVATSGPSGDQAALRLNPTTNTNNFWVNVQMSHFWLPGSAIHPHLHIQPQLNTQNTLTFTINYSISDINGTFPTNTSIPNLTAVIPAGSQWKHLLFDLPDTGIDMSAFAGPSTIIRFHYTLTAATNPIDVISFDCHAYFMTSPVDFTP